ncbi:olfactory receptor 14A16-like [Varanus komodoensis]|uniref:G-protein coupled receptors family 1 profile domain-containing protein n=1 Tax=Varanus komodoensis TaxID=61221 RepID=A0A8D2J2F4_VARKO|nr:olfactory receptor 14A16-like [Varanus komodoensis]
MSNLTSMFTFLLLEFSEVREQQILHFLIFLALYLIALTGNLLIIIAVSIDHHLHTPMYFFLKNLAILDLGAVSVMMPKSMAMSLFNNRSISYPGCVAQVFFYLFFATSGFVLLTLMAHDRNVAICNPLQYERIMHKGACFQMIAIAWIIGLLNAILQASGTFAITFCSHIVHQFFCEIPQLIKLSCSDMYLIEVGFLVLGYTLALGCFIFIIITYVKIFSAVLKIPSVHGQKKALSTCIPHITVVSLFVFMGLFSYVKPSINASSGLDIAFAVIYTIIPPMLNPFIYSIRNEEIKTVLRKRLSYGALF